MWTNNLYMIKNNLRINLLTYIAYCLERSFSYQKCQKDLESAGVKSTIPTLRKEFSLCKKDDLIDFKTYYRKPYPVLSQKGKFEIKTRLPFKKYGWDGSWKLVIFDIPESRRKTRLKLVGYLKSLSFGRLSRGDFISPHPLFSQVKKFALKSGIEDYVSYVKTSSIEEEKKKILQAWDLQKINEKYEKFIKKAQIVSFERKPFWPLYAKRLEKEFTLLYEKDPHLPEEILPADWKGQEAYGIFKAISNSY
jgi:phenylacetic acid degradation operon negative regulatory protein